MYLKLNGIFVPTIIIFIHTHTHTHNMSSTSTRTTFDLITVSLVCDNRDRILPLFDLILPVDSRQARKEAVLRIVTWLKDLRRFFDHDGPILPQLSVFLEHLAWPTFQDIKMIDFDAISTEHLSKPDLNTYSLSLGRPWNPVILSRDLSGEEFALEVCSELMK